MFACGACYYIFFPYIQQNPFLLSHFSRCVPHHSSSLLFEKCSYIMQQQQQQQQHQSIMKLKSMLELKIYHFETLKCQQHLGGSDGSLIYLLSMFTIKFQDADKLISYMSMSQLLHLQSFHSIAQKILPPN